MHTSSEILRISQKIGLRFFEAERALPAVAAMVAIFAQSPPMFSQFVVRAGRKILKILVGL